MEIITEVLGRGLWTINYFFSNKEITISIFQFSLMFFIPALLQYLFTKNSKYAFDFENAYIENRKLIKFYYSFLSIAFFSISFGFVWTLLGMIYRKSEFGTIYEFSVITGKMLVVTFIMFIMENIFNHYSIINKTNMLEK